MKWFLGRLSEPSSAAGITLIAADAQALAYGGDKGQAITSIFGGLLALLVKEKGAA